MTKGMFYKGLFIGALIVFAVALILPTVGEKQMQVTFIPGITGEQIQEIRSRFPESGFVVTGDENTLLIKGYKINDALMNEIKILPGVEDAVVLPHWAERTVLAKKMNLGLDLQGGMHLVLRADFESIERKKEKVLTEEEKKEITLQALELLRNRIDKFGVSEPIIRPRGAEAIEIQLPGVKDPESVKKAIGTTGRVEYRLVDGKFTSLAEDWLKNNINFLKDKKIPDTPEKRRELINKMGEAVNLPGDLELMFFFQRDDKSNQLFPAHPIALKKEIALAGEDISKAWTGQDDYGGLAVHFTTTPEGAAKFADVTSKKNHGKQMAIIIDEKVRSAPKINVQISSGQAMIQGDFTVNEVNALARIIKEGALPVNLKIIEERTVGPSLGRDSIEAGVKAVLIAFAGVMVFMIIYYKFAGIIADLGLILNFTFMLALLSWLGFTLTLPGIAGLILTIGMAVDGNILIYERIKEELRDGKSVRVSISNGFERAFWAIFDSNLTTLIAAFVLSQFGTGPIKGFAVTLSIGVICSMFVVLYVTRYFYELIATRKNISKLSI